MSAWLLDNEKYALIALEVRVDQRIPLQEFAPGYWAWTDVSLEVPAHWRDASVQVDEVEQAALFGRVQEQLIVSPPPGGAWRLFRALTVYVEARQTREVLDRLHQFCRCIDGLILSEPGKGSTQFKSRTVLFIGPRHHELMGQLYRIRSDIEHLHEHRYLEVFDRPTRLDLAEKAAIAEHIARNALGHVLRTSTLWPHFANSTNLASFWQLNSTERENLWGPATINPADALSGYDRDSIPDVDLGKRP